MGLALLIACGPRPVVDTTLRAVDLPRDPVALERALATQEAAVPNLRPGANKLIVWADPQVKAKTPLALVYLHGYSACRQETRPVADRVAQTLGANLYYTRLTGHGLPGERLAEASVNDWLNDAVEALEVGRRLGERVVLIGASTGGTLAAWLAAQPQGRDLAALVLISPNFRLKDPKGALLGWPWGGQLARAILGPERAWTPVNAEQQAHWTWRYPTRALVPLAGLLQLAERTDLSGITAPLLVIRSKQDLVIDPTAIDERVAGLKPAWVEIGESEDEAYHVLAGDILAPKGTPVFVDAMLSFLKPLQKQP